MKIEDIRNFLHDEADFKVLSLDKNEDLVFEPSDLKLNTPEKLLLQKSFWDHGLEAWINDQRIVVLKVYRSFTYLKKFWRENQIIISELLNFLPLKYKNNLYFLLILDFHWDQDSYNEVLTEKNRIEKNAMYCRKYVFQDAEDIERIPFFIEFEKKNRGYFSYEERFIELITRSSTEYHSKIIEIINDYFKPEMQTIYKDKSNFKLTIEKKLEVSELWKYSK
ncbi:ABC-three component system middle component 1 [Paenibacillus sp. ALE2]